MRASSKMEASRTYSFKRRHREICTHRRWWISPREEPGIWCASTHGSSTSWVPPTEEFQLSSFVFEAVQIGHGVPASAQSLNDDQCSACKEFLLVLRGLIFRYTQGDESAAATT